MVILTRHELTLSAEAWPWKAYSLLVLAEDVHSLRWFLTVQARIIMSESLHSMWAHDELKSSFDLGFRPTTAYDECAESSEAEIMSGDRISREEPKTQPVFWKYFQNTDVFECVLSL